MSVSAPASGTLERLWGGLAAEGDLPDGHRRPLFALLLIVFVLRFGLALALPNIHQADEIFQVSEQANRVLHGYGIVSWEFQTSSRPALLPTLVLPIYAVGGSAALHEALTAAIFTLFSLLPVWVAFHWAGRLYGLRGGIVAALVAGTWFELVYFAPKPTADAVCVYPFVAAIFWGRPAARTAAVAAAGAALTIALGIRMQIAPAVAVVFAAVVLSHDGRRRAALFGGAAAGLAIVGAIEWAWWGAPFRGHWGYLTMEFSRHASAQFGREPFTFFAKNAVLIYGGTLPVIAALAFAGARRAPILFLTLIALAIPFHFVGHKEYRFMVPAISLLVLLAGIGAAEATAQLAPRAPRAAWIALAAGWLMAMGAMSWSDSFRPFWFKDGGQIRAFRDIGAQPDACGVALENIRWWHTPGYAGIGRYVPIYEMLGGKDVDALKDSANYIIAATKSPAPPPPFEEWREYSRPLEKVYRRPGGCVIEPSKIIERPPIPVNGR